MVTAASKTYGDADPTLTGISPASCLPITSRHLTAAPQARQCGSPYTISAILSPAGVSATTISLTPPRTSPSIRRTPQLCVTAASKTYGDDDPTLTGTLTGFLPADNVTASLQPRRGRDRGGRTYTISAALSPTGVLANYNITNTPADFTINKKDASVTPDALSKTIGSRIRP